MLRTVYLLEGFDLIVEFHRQTNIIQPIQEAVFIKRIDFEPEVRIIREGEE